MDVRSRVFVSTVGLDLAISIELCLEGINVTGLSQSKWCKTTSGGM
jgi:hypothetical protein